MKRLYLILAILMTTWIIPAQGQVFKLDSITHDSIIHTCSGFFYDNNQNGNYSNNQDRWVTFCPGIPNRRIVLEFETFSLDQSDHMLIYQGMDTTAELFNFATTNSTILSGTDLSGERIYPAPTDSSGCLTIRFVSDNSTTAPGWRAKISCEAKCQDFDVALDSVFVKYDSLNNMSTRPVRHLFDVDTVTGDTTFFKAIDICLGDSVILHAKPLFKYNNLSYHQSDSTCVYYWDFGDGTTDTVNYVSTIGHKWNILTGYNLNLAITDTNNGGCNTKNTLDTRVRIAKNPIKTVAPLPDICSGETMHLNVGYQGNSSVIIDSIEFNQTAHESYAIRTFIPDGSCVVNGVTTSCYESPITFTSFTPGSTFQSGDELESLCISIEHSFLGDLNMYLVCPTGQRAILKYKCGGGIYLGIPLDGGQWDNDPKCDSNVNPIGTCWNYCWSNQYLTNAQGVISTTCPHKIGGNTLDSTHIFDSSVYYQTPAQNLSNPTQTVAETVDLTGFNSLVGCPLNGTWAIGVCDTWAADNGYVCEWGMTLGKASGANWTYQVPLDTVIWAGPFMSGFTQTTSIIQPPIDTSGTFLYNIHIIDDFGCSWDTVTTLAVVKTPIVNLGEDKYSCEGKGVTLDAGNPGATSYDWEPTGEHTQTIFANPPLNETGTKTYKVQVTNFNGKLYCYGLDSINLTVYPAATAAFTTDKFPLEGCEPYTFQLMSTSSNANQYEWTVGDETSTEANPSFTFPYGNYNLKLKVTSVNGCTDSISYANIINVFKNPVADFGWNPSTPYASDPTVHLINLTKPDNATNQYHWEIQTNKDNATDVNNVFGKEPSFTWAPQEGQTVAGEYHVYLDAYTVNTAPSGNIYECHDTISKVITIINDNIMFPTVVTPNGDGINDVFYIHNLVDGQAFPDNELSIYNRYGKRIYFIQDIRNEKDFWDPQKTNSPTGTYFYRFIGRGPIRNVEFKGSVEVIR